MCRGILKLQKSSGACASFLGINNPHRLKTQSTSLPHRILVNPNYETFFRTNLVHKPTSPPPTFKTSANTVTRPILNRPQKKPVQNIIFPLYNTTPSLPEQHRSFLFLSTSFRRI